MTGTILFAAFVLLAIGLSLRSLFYEWRAKLRNEKMKRLEDELQQLCREISTYLTPRLTTEVIPQKFPSKGNAIAFGEKWSRGGKDSYIAKFIDSNNFDEDHPSFDKASVSGGILYTYSALFFGMKEAHRDGDEWFMEFAFARNQWLKDYLAHLKSGQAS